MKKYLLVLCGLLLIFACSGCAGNAGNVDQGTGGALHESADADSAPQDTSAQNTETNLPHSGNATDTAADAEVYPGTDDFSGGAAAPNIPF